MIRVLRRTSLCELAAAAQVALALGAFAFGHPELAAAFGVFAIARIIALVAQRCADSATCAATVGGRVIER